MKKKIKFKPISKNETANMSTSELEKYVTSIDVECKRLIEETAMWNKIAKEEEKKAEIIRNDIIKLKSSNDIILKERGWGELTNDELNWLMVDNNYKKHWQYFIPDQRGIKEKYAEIHNIKVDDTLDKKFKEAPEMELRNAWIDRSGNYTGLDNANHNRWASSWMDQKYGIEGSATKLAESVHNYPFEFLQGLGWVRIMSWSGTKSDFILPKKMTFAQMKTIDKFCEIHELELPFDDHRFKK